MANGKYAGYAFELKPAPHIYAQNAGKLISSFIFGKLPWEKDPAYANSTIFIEADIIAAPGGLMGGGEEGYARSPELQPQKMVRGVHRHTNDEYFFLIGTNPDDPADLGGEYEFWLGAGGDAEKLVFNKTTCVHVPAGVFHNPHYATRVYRPFMLVVVMAGEWKSDYAVDESGQRVFPPGYKPPQG